MTRIFGEVRAPRYRHGGKSHSHRSSTYSRSHRSRSC
jgi:hypothetical protein